MLDYPGPFGLYLPILGSLTYYTIYWLMQCTETDRFHKQLPKGNSYGRKEEAHSACKRN